MTSPTRQGALPVRPQPLTPLRPPALRLRRRQALPPTLLLPLLLSPMAALPALAAEAGAEPPAVVIKGIRNPELKTYRVMAAGVDAFDDYHALAPAAKEVRFRLRVRTGASSVDMHNLALRVAGDTTSIPVPIADDHSFLLPRSAQARRENADLLLNKPKGGYRWQPEIRSDGVPDGMRRLGDLRLECKVLVATAKEEIGFMMTALVNSILLTTDWCGHEKLHMSTVTARPLAGATLLHGARRVNLELAGDGMGFVSPQGDKAYPDDTLIELRYADEPAA